MARQEKSGQSPYQKQGKSPFRYSDLYMRWKAAAMKGDQGEMRRLGAEHTRRFLGNVTPADLAMA